MKLYAITTSERASKGQGGNEYIHIEILQGNTKSNYREYIIDFTEDGLIVADNDFNELLITGNRDLNELINRNH